MSASGQPLPGPGGPIHLASASASYRWVALALLALWCCLTGGPGHAAAQQPGAQQVPVRLEVQAGYDESYRVGQWFPITVVASNDGPDLRGVLEWRFPGRNDGLTFQREVELSRGARKRLQLAAVSDDFARSGEVRLLVADAVVGLEQVRLSPVEIERLVIGVLSSDPTLLNTLDTLEFAPPTSGVSVVHLDPEALPDAPALLAGLDAIFLHDIATAELAERQRGALAGWVRQGGQLVVSGGASAARSIPGIDELLPVAVRGLEGTVPLEPLNELIEQNRFAASLETTVSRVELRPGAVALDSAGLLTAHRLGAGHVIFSGFDLSALRGIPHEPDLWQAVLGPNFDLRFGPATILRWQGSNLLQDVLDLPSRLPSLGMLTLFIVAYIVAVGPANFLVLRWLKRFNLAWVTIPATVALFSLGAYAAGFLIHGATVRILQITVVEGLEGAERGQASAFIGIFSPRRATYDLSFPVDTLISMERYTEPSFANLVLQATSSSTSVPDVLVDVSSLRTFIAERTVPLDARVASSLQRQGGRITGEVRNQSTAPLEDVVLVHGGGMQELGTLAPGAVGTVNIPPSPNNFPQGASLATDGVFNRRRLLLHLFGHADPTSSFLLPGGVLPPSTGILERDGVYLLAWQAQPRIDVQIEGTSNEHQGLTLAIVRLDTEAGQTRQSGQ